MILSFKHKGLSALWTNNTKRFLPSGMILKISRVLLALDSLKEFPTDLLLFPNWKLHELKGNRKGTWSITIKENWRITFKVKGLDIFDLDLEDYH